MTKTKTKKTSKKPQPCKDHPNRKPVKDGACLACWLDPAINAKGRQPDIELLIQGHRALRIVGLVEILEQVRDEDSKSQIGATEDQIVHAIGMQVIGAIEDAAEKGTGK